MPAIKRAHKKRPEALSGRSVYRVLTPGYRVGGSGADDASTQGDPQDIANILFVVPHIRLDQVMVATVEQEPVDFKADMLKKEVGQLEAAREGIAKRVWWLVGAAFVGLCGTTRAFGDAESAHEFRHTFGEVGANGALWALLIGGVWLVVDFFRGRKIAARIPVALAELRRRGYDYDYDYSARAWVWRAPKGAARENT